MVDITSALKTPGWMRPEELTWLAERAQEHSRIAELGSHLGRSTRALAEHTPGRVYAIDDWRGHSEFIGNIPSVILFGAFCENVIDLMNRGKVYVVKRDHASPEIMTVTFPCDMAFIDGDHEYKAVSRDIRNWLSWLAPGALLCGHDYDWSDVRQAVDELVPGRELVPDTSIWWRRF